MPANKPDSPDFELSESPGHLLHRAQQFAAERFVTAMDGTKLTQRQFAVLMATSQREGLTQSELGKVTGIDRSTLAELVARMVRNGVLDRRKLAEDARVNTMHMTEAGRALLDTAAKGAREADKAILSALPKNKRAAFLETLRRIALTLEKGEEEAEKARKKAKEKKKKAKKKAKEKEKARKAEKKAKKKKAEKAGT
ncbi:MarR family winged helix-turn-helix transcriptional regulator [Maricaulis sp. CAU 1757]